MKSLEFAVLVLAVLSLCGLAAWAQDHDRAEEGLAEFDEACYARCLGRGGKAQPCSDACREEMVAGSGDAGGWAACYFHCQTEDLRRGCFSQCDRLWHTTSESGDEGQSLEVQPAASISGADER